MSSLERALRAEQRVTPEGDRKVLQACRARARAMLADLKRNNPKAADMLLDPSPHVAAVCPRRAGKTYTGALAALITGEAKPNSISLVISLNLKQLRRLYWTGGPSGLHAIDRRYGLGLKFHDTYLRWTHTNGSFGYLLGTEDADQIEVIRGLEADLYLVDECKSFVPTELDTLIDEIIDPQRASRKGRVVLIGTPGNVMSGAFYRATCPEARDPDGKPYAVGISTSYETTERVDQWGRTPALDGGMLWSAHHWSLQDNGAMPHQWEAALAKKAAMGWTDDDPTWRREYLGQWAQGGSGLVFRYAEEKPSGRVTWRPERTYDNPTGLPPEGAPWHLVGGLDIGYEAPTALVIGAYSQRMRQLRHVWDHSQSHMLVPDIAELIERLQERFGLLENVYADVGNLGKMIVESLVKEYGFPIVRADKREKNDHIELLNGAFARGEVLIIENTPLEIQLLTNAWKIPNDRPETIAELARRGRLHEDDSIPNDSTDAFLYMYRGSAHQFALGPTARTAAPEARTAEWEAQQLAEYRRQARGEMSNIPSVARRAMRNTWTIPSFLARGSARRY